jgi:hypothetical protein
MGLTCMVADGPERIDTLVCQYLFAGDFALCRASRAVTHGTAYVKALERPRHRRARSAAPQRRGRAPRARVRPDNSLLGHMLAAQSAGGVDEKRFFNF